MLIGKILGRNLQLNLHWNHRGEAASIYPPSIFHMLYMNREELDNLEGNTFKERICVLDNLDSTTFRE